MTSSSKKNHAKSYAQHTKASLMVQAVQNGKVTYKQADIKQNVSVGTMYHLVKRKTVKRARSSTVNTGVRHTL